MLKNNFFKNMLGIEFRDKSLAAVCLKKDFTGIRIISSLDIPSSYNAMGEDDISELRRFITQHKVDARSVSVSIPAEWSLVKFMDISAPDKDALGQMLRYELERHIPFQMEDVYHSFRIAGKTDNSYRAVTVIVQRERIEQIKEFLENLSLQAGLITLSSFAVLNAVGFSEYGANIVREISGFQKTSGIFGGRKDVAVVLFTEQDNWNMAVIKGGSCINFKQINLNSDKSDMLWNDISREMTAALSELSIEKADRLVISGHLSPECRRFVADKAGMPVKLVEKFAFYNHSALDMDKLPSAGACLSISGVVPINVLPDKDMRVGKAGRLIAKLSLAAIVIFFCGFAVSWIDKERRSADFVEKGIKKNEPEVRAVEALASELSNMEKQKKFLKDVKAGGIGRLKMLSELTAVIPADAWVTNLAFKEIKDGKNGYSGEVTINGFAGSSAKLIGLLENSPLFENVEFISPVTKGMQGEGFK
ncbi:MAG: PilN domain-containing protein, partial [Nitrospirae bacterium]|nr:PilN domain-containing protein [Nitrospirota bacterium]